MPQISVTVTKGELAEMHGKAGAATLSNYVRERLGLPALQRGRGSAARANDEATRPPADGGPRIRGGGTLDEAVEEHYSPVGRGIKAAPTVMHGMGTDVEMRGTNTELSSDAAEVAPPAPREVLSEQEWEREYDDLINAPDADCPDCGAQPLRMHREGCKGAPDEPAHELSYESDDKPSIVEGDFAPTNVKRRAK